MPTKPIVLERNDERGVWCVERTVEPEKAPHVAVFYGPDAARRAREYAEYLEDRPAH